MIYARLGERMKEKGEGERGGQVLKYMKFFSYRETAIPFSYRSKRKARGDGFFIFASNTKIESLEGVDNEDRKR